MLALASGTTTGSHTVKALGRGRGGAVTLITCIVPCHNGARFLAEALDSILAQDHRPLEIVVVDDGSTDPSAEIAMSYGERVRLQRQAWAGPAAARNAGIAAATGEHIAFLDADDLYLEGKLALQLEELVRHPEADVCLCQAENVWEPGLEAEHERYKAVGKLRATYHLDCMLARRSVFEAVGGFDPALRFGDYVEWFFRVTDACLDVRVIPLVLVSRRLHEANHTRSAATLDGYIDLVHARICERRNREALPKATAADRAHDVPGRSA